jgi:adenylosuccinate synthase
VVPLLEGNTCVVGLQWGDEGKGKIVDYLAEHADVVVRYCGGANAGHTVRIGGEKYSTHLLPVGIFHKGVLNLIGNGVVIDPAVLFQEIDEFLARGIAITPQNLRVSYKAHLVMPYHMQEDAAREQSSEGAALGTTRRGIGPAYADKMQRTTAVRVADLSNEDKLRHKIGQVVSERNQVLKVLYDSPPLDWRQIFEQYRDFGRRLQPFVDDVGHILLEQARVGKRILFEGAHAVLLDVDHGTYPYVTSSNCSSLGLFTGAGVPPQLVHNYLGIMKSYSTRVGAGPFPTEQDNDIGSYIRERGNEYGTTTGRPRRCGWFDAVAVRYAVAVTGASEMALTNLDVLSSFPVVRVAEAYEHPDLPGRRVQDFPLADLALHRPLYRELPGWPEEIQDCRRFDDLPRACRAYVELLEELVGIPASLLSVGPRRDQVVRR